MVDIDQLTNEEIREQLMTHGCDPGPVVGSTRNVYANKLRRLLEDGLESDVVAPPEDNRGNGIVNDGSDDDLRGEESSRILLPTWKEDHAYSAEYDSKQDLMARCRLDANSATQYNQTSRYNSGVAFENFYSGHGNRCNSLVNKQKASRKYGKIGLTLLFIITAVIFMFFVVQNYAELERGEGNKEEF
ncbi:Uncharacterized protein BM_BM5037 [Brugia malayi]|uniref:LEM domain containing protein n=1 Tax=Brugia malayi TaxID=6279 RepID=A0A4E9FFU9_BRUMA|nr:Uncharacterized protein BM_BM5037 [Brugia malayi]VIO95184.1 Uncharacterized protein BM_BM5037 [Brugia malayi]